MVIIIGNQKGGAGKSTFTMLFANYLTGERQREVLVLDMDYQQSIAQKFDSAKVLENAEPYLVIAAGLEDFPNMLETFHKNPQKIFLVDLPGKLDDDGLIAVFQSADLVICPFAYDEFTFKSTVLFSMVLKKINPEVPITYVPNRVKANVRYDITLEVNAQLLRLGTLTNAIPDRIDFQRANTFLTPATVEPVVRPVFEQIAGGHMAEWLGLTNKPVP